MKPPRTVARGLFIQQLEQPGGTVSLISRRSSVQIGRLRYQLALVGPPLHPCGRMPGASISDARHVRTRTP